MRSHDLRASRGRWLQRERESWQRTKTIPTPTRRFDTLGTHSTEESRRRYRETLFTLPGAAEFISGVIMYDETIRQKGRPETLEISTWGQEAASAGVSSTEADNV